MRKSVETRVLGTMDEVLFGEIPNTALYSDRQEFQEAQEIFKNAEIGKEFSGTVYWKMWLKPHLTLMAEMAKQSENNYMGADPQKIEKLRQQRILTKYALDYITGLVEDATTLPRPVFQNEQ